MRLTYEETQIREGLAKIQTPAYDVAADVQRRLCAAPPARPILKRAGFAAAALCALLALLGAGRLMGWKTFDLFGGVHAEPDPSVAATPLPDTSTSAAEEAENAFLSEAKAGEARLVLHEDGRNGAASLGALRSGDWAQIEALVRNGTAPILLPASLPEGYTLAESVVEFYADEDCLGLAPRSSVQQDGWTYEVYDLPETYAHHIVAVRLHFSDAEGNDLTWQARLTSPLDENHSFGYGAPDSAVSETLTIPGYDTALSITDGAKGNGLQSILALYKGISPIRALHPLSLNAAAYLDRASTFDEDGYLETYGAVIYSIEASNLDAEALLRIARSMA